MEQPLQLGSLFSGIEGFGLAAKQCGIETAWQVEINAFCRQILQKNFPNASQLSDIRDAGKRNLNWVDILTGGFPCQPFSVAGNRKGQNDNRFLWPEMLRVIHELRPTYIIGENVPGIVSLALDQVLDSLEKEGYATETFIIPACGVDAPHRRDRVWIMAYPRHYLQVFGSNPDVFDSAGQRWETLEVQAGKPGQTISTEAAGEFSGTDSGLGGVSDPNGQRWQQQHPSSLPIQQGQPSGIFTPERSFWSTEPGICRVADGVPNRVERITALGNAIVPQVAYELLLAIKELDRLYRLVA